MARFEEETIGYTLNRLRDAEFQLRKRLQLSKTVSTIPEEEKQAQQNSEFCYGEQLLHLVQEQGVISRDHSFCVARLAYKCAQSTELPALMIRRFGEASGTIIWRLIRSLAKPVFACCLFGRVASELPQFRNLKLCPRNPPDALLLNRRLIVSIDHAWQELGLWPPTEATKASFNQWDSDFKSGCSQMLSTHAEVQLQVLYQVQPHLEPTMDYLGCSKNACLLCEAYLLRSPIRLRVRGRHGGCYPLWGIPRLQFKNTERILTELADILIQRIQEIKYTPLFTQALPQSGVVSDLNSKDLGELNERKKAVAEQQRSSDAIRTRHKLLCV